jgi:hypothetical protein
MSDRCAAVIFFARPEPPFRPLTRLDALTRPLGVGLSSGEPSSFSPIACSTTRRAVTVKSWAEPCRLGMTNHRTSEPRAERPRFSN